VVVAEDGGGGGSVYGWRCAADGRVCAVA